MDGFRERKIEISGESGRDMRQIIVSGKTLPRWDESWLVSYFLPVFTTEQNKKKDIICFFNVKGKIRPFHLNTSFN